MNKLLIKTDVKFKGCTIWLETEKIRDGKHAAIRLNKWFLSQIGETALFIGDKNAPTGRTKNGPSTTSHTK